MQRGVSRVIRDEKIEYRVCDICGQKMDVNDYYTLKIDSKSKKAKLKSDWKWLEICQVCKTDIEELIKSKKRKTIVFEEEN